jgi:competence protein ComEA
VPVPSRSQLLVYGALAVVVLLVGARWISGAEERGSPAGGVAFAAEEDDAAGALAVSAGGDVIVHVAGAVRDPGVYRLPEGSRVTDAIQRAGGPSPAAAPDGLNLAARVADGQQVLLPARASGGGVAAPGAPTTDGPIGLGSATLEELDTIEGIGPVTAQDILDFRDEQGGLSSIEELDEVSGIGPATMEALRDRLQP